MDIPRSFSEAYVYEPLTWKPVTRKNDSDSAIVVCVNGHSGLIEEHKISDDGTVTPSVVCTQNHCNWHTSIVLTDWRDRYHG